LVPAPPGAVTGKFPVSTNGGVRRHWRRAGIYSTYEGPAADHGGEELGKGN